MLLENKAHKKNIFFLGKDIYFLPGFIERAITLISEKFYLFILRLMNPGVVDYKYHLILCSGSRTVIPAYLLAKHSGARVVYIGTPKFRLMKRFDGIVSTKKDLLTNISENFIETDFAVTDLSHSKAIIEIEGKDTKEILKKGCPFNFNTLEKNNSINSTYNGIAFTVDLLGNNPDKVRLFALRSFGESLYHSVTDASLEFGFKSL